MSLLKRGDTYTSMVWLDGVRYYRALHTGNKRTAEKLDQAFKEELQLKVYQQPQLNLEMTFGEVFTRFLAEADVKEFHTQRSKFFLASSGTSKSAGSPATMLSGIGSFAMRSSSAGRRSPVAS